MKISSYRIPSMPKEGENEFVIQYKPFAKYILNKTLVQIGILGFTTSPLYPDLLQAADIGVLKGYRGYDPQVPHGRLRVECDLPG